MSEHEPPGYDDWFDEPEPPTLEQGRGAPAVRRPFGTEEDVWTLPEDEALAAPGPSEAATSAELTTTQIAIIGVSCSPSSSRSSPPFGVFNGSSPTTPPVMTRRP